MYFCFSFYDKEWLRVKSQEPKGRTKRSMENQYQGIALGPSKVTENMSLLEYKQEARCLCFLASF